jgi:GT2 family glycosyltransferase
MNIKPPEIVNQVSTISFIIPTYHSSTDLKIYFDSFLKYNKPENIFFSVIDTSQDRQLLQIVKEYSGKISIHVHFIENRGYAHACNYGYDHAPASDIYIFSNPDIIFTSTIIDRIREDFSEDNYGTVMQKNSRSENCTFNLYPQYRNLITELLFIHKVINLVNWYNPRFTAIAGAFMILGRHIIRDNGLFDDNYFLYYEEDDYFYRLRNNRNFRIIRDRHVVHNISSSVDKNLALNRFKMQMNSLYHYSRKFNDFGYFRNLIMLYGISSRFLLRHKEKLNFLLEKDISG